MTTLQSHERVSKSRSLQPEISISEIMSLKLLFVITTGVSNHNFSFVYYNPPLPISISLFTGVTDPCICDAVPIEVWFEPSSYTVNEVEGIVTLTIRTNVAGGPPPDSVIFSTSDGTAIGSNNMHPKHCYILKCVSKKDKVQCPVQFQWVKNEWNEIIHHFVSVTLLSPFPSSSCLMSCSVLSHCSWKWLYFSVTLRRDIYRGIIYHDCSSLNH